MIVKMFYFSHKSQLESKYLVDFSLSFIFHKRRMEKC